MSAKGKIAVIHGPSLDRLGVREPEIYGHHTLADVDEGLRELAAELGWALESSQHNGEGALVDAIHASADGGARGLVINPAAYTHTSIALRDAVCATELAVVEVHISNPYAREPFRHHSTIADVVLARVMGFGVEGYRLALRGLIAHLEGDPRP